MIACIWILLKFLLVFPDQAISYWINIKLTSEIPIHNIKCQYKNSCFMQKILPESIVCDAIAIDLVYSWFSSTILCHYDVADALGPNRYQAFSNHSDITMSPMSEESCYNMHITLQQSNKICLRGQGLGLLKLHWLISQGGKCLILQQKQIDSRNYFYIWHIEGILPKGPTRHAYPWQIGPFWQATLDMSPHRSCSNTCQIWTWCPAGN